MSGGLCFVCDFVLKRDEEKPPTLSRPERSLHTALLEAVIASFEDEVGREAGSQLIFTMNCDPLLEGDTVGPLLRRDQIWFVDRTRYGDSVLYALDEFQVRKAESIRRGYRLGCYRAIPMLSPFCEEDI